MSVISLSKISDPPIEFLIFKTAVHGNAAAVFFTKGFIMSNKALELFTAVPKMHNCAQAVAEGCGHPEMVAELASCGGGRAPEGLCGALHSA